MAVTVTTTYPVIGQQVLSTFAAYGICTDISNPTDLEAIMVPSGSSGAPVRGQVFHVYDGTWIANFSNLPWGMYTLRVLGPADNVANRISNIMVQ